MRKKSNHESRRPACRFRFSHTKHNWLLFVLFFWFWMMHLGNLLDMLFHVVAYFSI